VPISVDLKPLTEAVASFMDTANVLAEEYTSFQITVSDFPLGLFLSIFSELPQCQSNDAQNNANLDAYNQRLRMAER